MADQKKQGNPSPTILSLKIGEIKETKSGFVVPLIAKLFKGMFALKNVEITFKQDISEVGKAVTDQTGEAVFNHVVSLSEEDTIINFRAISEVHECSENAIIPLKKEIKNKKKKGPKIIQMSRYSQDNQPGVYTVWAQVQSENGSAYKGRVVFTIRGEHFEVICDRNGYADLVNNPVYVAENEVVEVKASINEASDGITDPTYLILRRPRIWAHGWTREWFRSARGIAGIARWAICISLIIFAIVVLFSDYDSVLMPVKKHLSEEQKLLEKISFDEKIILPESKGEFPGGMLMTLLFVTIIVYGSSLALNLGMLRDSVVSTFDKISNKFRSRASDPLSEIILEWAKVLFTSKRKESNESEGKDETRSKFSSKGASFSGIFASGILAEIVGELIIKLVPAIFLKTKLK